MMIHHHLAGLACLLTNFAYSVVATQHSRAVVALHAGPTVHTNQCAIHTKQALCSVPVDACLLLCTRGICFHEGHHCHSSHLSLGESPMPAAHHAVSTTGWSAYTPPFHLHVCCATCCTRMHHSLAALTQARPLYTHFFFHLSCCAICPVSFGPGGGPSSCGVSSSKLPSCSTSSYLPKNNSYNNLLTCHAVKAPSTDC